MLDEPLASELATHLQRMAQPLELVASVDDSATARDMLALLRQIAALRSDKITLRTEDDDDDAAAAGAVRKPSFSLAAAGAGAPRLRFAGLPLGHEFSSLVLALLWAGGHAPKVDAQLLEQAKALEGDYGFEIFMSQSCHNCPEVVQALCLLALVNPAIRSTVIEGGAFQPEVDARSVMAVPTVFLNGHFFASGRMTLAEILTRLDAAGAARAQRPTQRAPYDMLIVGGGPAGVAAAVYAARKGIRCALVAERLGGQVNDTAAIENYIAQPATDGPRFCAALRAQLGAHEVELIEAQRAESLHAGAQGGLTRVQLASGASLSARSVVLATGARWRNVNVPGEAEYRNRGVAYCPHCDGPLFKGKRTAVIGGGNSGVEAAVDLAGICTHVTLLEFAPQLRADAVLVRKLESLPNVSVHTNAQTSAISGAGGKVDGLHWRERSSGAAQQLALEGVFVQIGLLPNTDWLKGSVALSASGEVLVDARGQTNLPGVFAAGDCSTVPFKQIVIAAGEGAKAALGAYEHLLRTPAAAAVDAPAAQ